MKLQKSTVFCNESTIDTMVIYTLISVLSLLAASNAVPNLDGTNEDSSCTITDYSQVDSVVSNCTNIVIGDLLVPAGEVLTLNLQEGTNLVFKGTVKFGYKEWKVPLIVVSGTKLNVTGAPGHVIDGEGARYWDGKGDTGKWKPFLFRIIDGSGTFANINLLNCPRLCVSIVRGYKLTLTGWNVDVSDGDANNKIGHSTDGFDIVDSNHVHIENSVVKNQDDCVAVISGKNLHFNNLTCSGGHGLSLIVGMSLDDPALNTVENVTFLNSRVENSRTAIHIRTRINAPGGYIKRVTFRNIEVSLITNYAINVQQDYKDGSSTGKPNNNIPISDLVVANVHGNMTTHHAMAVYILCGESACHNFKWSKISIDGTFKKNSCNFSPTGFEC